MSASYLVAPYAAFPRELHDSSKVAVVPLQEHERMVGHPILRRLHACGVPVSSCIVRWRGAIDDTHTRRAIGLPFTESSSQQQQQQQMTPASLNAVHWCCNHVYLLMRVPLSFSSYFAYTYRCVKMVACVISGFTGFLFALGYKVPFCKAACKLVRPQITCATSPGPSPTKAGKVRISKSEVKPKLAYVSRSLAALSPLLLLAFPFRRLSPSLPQRCVVAQNTIPGLSA